MRSAILASVAVLAPLPLLAAQAPATEPDAILKAHGVEPTPAGVLGYIRPLTGEQLRGYVQQLGHADYAKRQQATLYLAALPVVPVGALNRAAASGDPEIRYRAKIILNRAKKGRNTKLLHAVLKKIRGKGYSDAAPILVDLIPQLGRADLETAAAESLFAIAAPKHAELLRTALKESDHVRLRMAAMRSLTKVAGDKAIPDLRSVLSDDDDRVRIAAAAALVKLKQRDALETLAKLLKSHNV
ncbi:MAG: HEAT repeat domain-containing protein [Planctomycetaceae bacterium]